MFHPTLIHATCIVLGLAPLAGRAETGQSEKPAEAQTPPPRFSAYWDARNTSQNGEPWNQYFYLSPGQSAGAGHTTRAVRLGVHVRAADATLRAHLGLPDGVGLVVEHIVPGGAAEAAGLKQHDVLERFDDQLLVNRQQLTSLIAMHAAGDNVRIELYRAGEAQRVSVELTEQEVANTNLFFGSNAASSWHAALARTHDLSDPSTFNCQSCHQISTGQSNTQWYYDSAVNLFQQNRAGRGER